MITYDIPCPYCCHHITITPQQFKQGCVARCKKCHMGIKISAHPDHQIDDDKEKR